MKVKVPGSKMNTGSKMKVPGSCDEMNPGSTQVVKV